MTSRPSYSNIFSPVQVDASFSDSILDEETFEDIPESVEKPRSGKKELEKHSRKELNSFTPEKQSTICKALFGEKDVSTAGDGKVSLRPSFEDVFESEVHFSKSSRRKNTNKLSGDGAFNFHISNSEVMEAPFVTTRRSNDNFVTVRSDRLSKSERSPKPGRTNRISKEMPTDFIKTLEIKSQAFASSESLKTREESIANEKNDSSVDDLKSSYETCASLNDNRKENTPVHRPKSLNFSSETKEKCEGIPSESTDTNLRFVSSSSSDKSETVSKKCDDGSSIASNSQPQQVQTTTIEKLIKDAVSEEFEVVRQMLYLQHISLYKLLDKKMEELELQNEGYRQFMAEAFETVVNANNLLWKHLYK